MDVSAAATLAQACDDRFFAGAAWWPLFPLLWLGLIFAFFFFVGPRLRRGWAKERGGMPAEAVLGERYARGEVDDKEYRERLEVLRRNRD